MKNTVTLDLKEYENLKQGISKINEANIEIIKEKNKKIKELDKIIKNDYIITENFFGFRKFYKKSEGIYAIEKELEESYKKQITELKKELEDLKKSNKIDLWIFSICSILFIISLYFFS